MSYGQPSWERLAEKFSKKGFLPSPMRVREDMGDTVLSASKAPATVAGLVTGVVGAGFAGGGVYMVMWDWMTAFVGIPFMLIGSAVSVGGFYMVMTTLANSRQLLLAMNGGSITFRRGKSQDELSMPTSDLQVRLSGDLMKGKDFTRAAVMKVSTWRGLDKYRLELIRISDPGRPILLAKSQNRKDLEKAYNLLAAVVKEATDGSLLPVMLADGRVISICTDAIGEGGANFRTCQLVMNGQGVAEVRPTAGARLFFGAFLGFGVLGLAMFPSVMGEGFSAVIPLLVGGVFLLVGLLGVTGRFTPSVRFDLTTGIVTKKGRKPPVPDLATGLPLDRVAALQMCSYIQEGGSDSPSYTVFELNAVLADGGQRFTIMSDCNRDRLVAQAQKLSDFLALELIDSG